MVTHSILEDRATMRFFHVLRRTGLVEDLDDLHRIETRDVGGLYTVEITWSSGC